MEIKGQIISGGFADILIRQKFDKEIEVGELLVTPMKDGYMILQVFNIEYASQIPQLARELMAGFKLEKVGTDLTTFDAELRNYLVIQAKGLLHLIKNGTNYEPVIPKKLPPFFSEVQRIEESDLEFMDTPKNPLYLGNVRSGSRILTTPVHLDAFEVLTQHALIPATTGRGKSNFMKVLLWSLLPKAKFGILVLDPHDEYFGRGTSYGLKDHPDADTNHLKYYSLVPPPGNPLATTLTFNAKIFSPFDFMKGLNLTDVQADVLKIFYNVYEEDWMRHLICDDLDALPENLIENKISVNVVRRKFESSLGIVKDKNNEDQILCLNKLFATGSVGETTMDDIVESLENGKIVIIDTSQLPEFLEILIGSMICNRMLENYKHAKFLGKLEEKPPFSVVLEEAIRVLGKRILDKGENVYSTIAREGRKFKVGIIAITQLTSMIPDEILANMNTKIILGNNNKSERAAIINSAAQDLSDDDKNIGTLDKGEAIVSSNFSKWAIPVKFPFFNTLVDETRVKVGKKITKPKFNP